MTRSITAAFLALLALSLAAPAPAAAFPQEVPAAEKAAPPKPQAPEKPAVRVLALRGAYEDHPTGMPFDVTSLLTGSFEKPRSFARLCEELEAARKDEGLKGLLFDLSSQTFALNLAQVSELTRRIGRLREAGKGTYAWLENASLIHYAVAAACDKVAMAELGILDFVSLSLATLHFKDAMDLLGVRATTVRSGDYKGAVEPFTLSEMSPHLRRHYAEMLRTMNDALVAGIAAGRRMKPGRVRELQGDRLFTSTQARAAGLVDALAPHGASREAIGRLAGDDLAFVEPPRKERKPMSFMALMTKILGGGAMRKAAGPCVAVLHLDGPIVDGDKDSPGSMVSGPTAREIRELEEDDAVRAVVVRINSPGGSATASEAIRLALERLAARKPVVVSMGEMAASGGYWITCFGRPIYAEPGTLTGSIGAFALKLDLGPLLNRIGLRFEQVALDESAGATAPNRGWTDEERARFQNLLDEVYGRFLDLVASSRKMSREKVPPIAGGRVWSGAQAKEIGIVDHLGGLDQAIAAAGEAGKLEPGFPVLRRPRPKDIFESLDLFGLGDAGDDARTLLDRGALATARRAGFRLAVPLRLAAEALEGGPPRIWLLAPTEMVIR